MAYGFTGAHGRRATSIEREKMPMQPNSLQPSPTSRIKRSDSPTGRDSWSESDSFLNQEAIAFRFGRLRLIATAASRVWACGSSATSRNTQVNLNIMGGSTESAARPHRPPLAGRARRTPAVPRASHAFDRYLASVGVGCLFAFVITASIRAQTIFYVDDDAIGAGDGSSWVDAYTDLQTALDAVQMAVGTSPEIHVAAGTYYPAKQTSPDDPRSATFSLISGVAIYGGFSGTETEPTERDWNANPTILSGDLLGDDLPGFLNRSDNVYHVLWADDHDDLILLDGLVIRGGYANGGSSRFGGGLSSRGDVVLQNCSFSDNWAGAIQAPGGNEGTVAHSNGGGAVAVFQGDGDDGTPRVAWSNCRFSDNASSGTGGAVFFTFASFKCSDCIFERNSALGGGAIGTEKTGSVVLHECEFIENIAGSDYSSGGGGGAIAANFGTQTFTILRSTFVRNSAHSGGAIDLQYGGFNMQGCSFECNESAEKGGGVYLGQSGTQGPSTISDCVFTGNHSRSAGAIYLPRYGDEETIVKNCDFRRNVVDDEGGACLFNGSGRARVRFTDCQFTMNLAGRDGGALHLKGGDSSAARCVFQENGAGEGGAVYVFEGASTFEDSDFQLNYATLGGAIAVAGPSYTTLSSIRSRFSGNSATVGGGVSVAGESPEISIFDSLLVDNLAELYGGAIAGGDGELIVSRSTIANNQARALGGGIISGTGTQIRSSILWGNVVDPRGAALIDEFAQIDGNGSTRIDYSMVQGWSGGYAGVGTTGDDPLLVIPEGPDGYGPLTANLRLSSGSPAINAGDPDSSALRRETDLDGHARVLCDRVDIGAYEFGIGDFNCDRQIDMSDFSVWPACMTNPRPSFIRPGCEAFDFNADSDVDLSDFAANQRSLEVH